MDFKALLGNEFAADPNPKPYPTREPAVLRAPSKAAPTESEPRSPTFNERVRSGITNFVDDPIGTTVEGFNKLGDQADTTLGDMVPGLNNVSVLGLKSLDAGQLFTGAGLARDIPRLPGQAYSAGMIGSLGSMDDAISAPAALINAARSDTPTTFMEEYEKVNDTLDGYYDRIPIRDKIVGGIAGGVLGAPGKIAKAIEGTGRWFGTGTGILGGIKRAGMNAVGAGTEAAIFSALEGERDRNQLALDAGVGAVIGVAGQVAFGETLPAILKGLTRGRQETVLEGIVDRGTMEGDSGLTFRDFQRVAESADKIESPYELNLPPQAQANYLERIAGLIARTSFPRHMPGQSGGTVAQDRSVVAAVANAKAYRDTLPKKHATELKQFLAPSRSRRQRRAAKDQSLAPFRKEYDRLFGTKPMPDGTEPPGMRMLPGTQVQKDFTAALQDVTNGADNPQLLSYATEAQRIMRATSVDPIAQTKHMRPTNTYEVGEELGPVPLHRVLYARKKIADRMAVGSLQDGSTITQQNAADARAVVKALDQMLDDQTGDLYSKNKDAFAAVMARDEAYEAGRTLVANPTRDMPEEMKGPNATTVAQFMKNKKIPLEEREALRRGFNDAIYDSARTDSTIDVANNLIGNPYTPSARNEEGRDLFRTVLGKDPDEFYMMADGQVQRADALNLVIEAFRRKQQNPEAMLSITREGDKYILTDPFVGQNENSFSSIAMRSALGRALMQPGEGTAMNTVNLLKQPDSASTKQVLRGHIAGGSVPGTIEGQGIRGGPGNKEVFDDAFGWSEYDTEDMKARITGGHSQAEEGMEGIMGYLN